MRLTFLGTGTSFGVPQIGCGCAVCRSPDPRDRRTRVGALVETDAGARLLIDTPPELRLQLVAAGVDDVDAVLFTHDHAVAGRRELALDGGGEADAHHLLVRVLVRHQQRHHAPHHRQLARHERPVGERQDGHRRAVRHTVSTLSWFVVPGTSNGTPAVTITRLPGSASPRRRTASSPTRTMSS